VDEGWSVREMEARVRGEVAPPAGEAAEETPRRARPAGRTVTADVKRIEDALRKHLGTDVRVTTRRRGRGFLTLSYYSNDDLARLLELMLGRPFQG
jgi:ParB-like chromosome segregation protein Spo0J